MSPEILTQRVRRQLNQLRKNQERLRDSHRENNAEISRTLREVSEASRPLLCRLFLPKRRSVQ